MDFPSKTLPFGEIGRVFDHSFPESLKIPSVEDRGTWVVGCMAQILLAEFVPGCQVLLIVGVKVSNYAHAIILTSSWESQVCMGIDIQGSCCCLGVKNDQNVPELVLPSSTNQVETPVDRGKVTPKTHRGARLPRASVPNMQHAIRSPHSASFVENSPTNPHYTHGQAWGKAWQNEEG